ncbi:sec-independent protein translocase protein TATB, chloroplastic isoform X2 [Lolium perenne]|uniref:sec-independent protein translocase protein TATB, chloroplastic isoform X2 n=1 Tax=Lolium perenne TaxID=4522 RepID=UPI0021F51A7B|nr:sec-independent protein translocase protein TATB, chloroplastic isoform X2 [Lolium perenne]
MWLHLQPYLELARAPMSSSIFLCSAQVRYASLPAPLRQPGRHARLPPAAPAFVSHGSHRPPPLHWTGSGIRMISSSFGRRRRNGICASLFGVGAPEALVIGVVALLVFGPKGLAEVARNLGKTLRAFQPTIRELQDVSRDFRSTLEREIGLDEDPPSTSYRPPPTNNSQPPAVNQDVKPETAVPYTSEELMKVTEEQLAASAIAAWNAQQPPSSEQQETAAAPSQSSDTASSGEGDGAVTNESNSSNTEKVKPRDEA